MVCQLGADAEEDGVELSCGLLGQNVTDPVLADDLHPHRLDPGDLPGQAGAGQAISGNPVVHHPARRGIGIVNLHLVTHPPQLVGAGEAGRSGTDDQHSFPGGSSHRHRPALLEGEIPQKPIQRVDGDRRVEELAIAGALARMVASPPVRAGERFSSMYLSHASRYRPAWASASQAWMFSPAGQA